MIIKTDNINGLVEVSKTVLEVREGYPKFNVTLLEDRNWVSYLRANGDLYEIDSKTTPFEALQELKEIL